jgi:transposase-like protein
MATSYLSAPQFHDEAAAFAFVESHLWPTGPVCPRCASQDRIGKLAGKSTRMGVYKCYACRKPFTVRVGTIFEDSHVALKLWLQAIFLIASSKKGISSNQLHRTLGVTLKTAWFMSHRIRFAMTDGTTDKLGGFGTSGIVEADETYIGKTRGQGKGAHLSQKQPIVALVERKGRVRAFHVPTVTAESLKTVLHSQIDESARLMTDGAGMYRKIGKHFASHEWVDHSAGEYARGDVTTNTVESFFGVLKRGLRGVYQHVSAEHLNRYVTEFEFRHNNRVALEIDDKQRADNLLTGVAGKRLTYHEVV